MARAFLTGLELMVALAVLRVDEDAYGVTIAREIADTAGREVSLAVVYATLARLESAGLVTSALGAPTATRGGRAKKLFRVTGRGMRAIQETQDALRALGAGIPALKGSTV